METVLPDWNFSHYRVLRKLGSGGMGTVYLAEDLHLNRKVAVKVLHSDMASDPERLRRFEQEARAASSLNHPNILTVFEFVSENGVYCLITELVEGRTLRELIRTGELTIPEALVIAEQIAFALSAAHSVGIVHRDLKPENILVRDDGIVKVVDFGLAKLIETSRIPADEEAETRALVQTNPGSVMGTAAYMSPEQARGKDADGRSDIWSLGAVLYEMISGRMPFSGDSANEVIASILKTEPEPIARYAPGIPHDLEKLIGKTLRKNRDERYQNTKDLWLDLRDLRQELEYNAKLEHSAVPNRTGATTDGEAPQTLAGSSTAGGLTAATDPSAHPVSAGPHSASSAEYLVSEIRQHKRAFLSLAAVLVIALVAGIGWWYLRSGPSTADAAEISSLAVLPFENGSGDPDMDHLSDGLSMSLIDKLSQLPQLKVIARTSSFKYRGPNIDIQDVAEKLGVQAIIMGRVVKLGDKLNVRVEMIDAHNNKQLWGEQYSRKATDALAIQQEIAQTVSDKLRLRLSGSQQQQLAKVGTNNPQAYELFLKGKFLHERGGPENRKKANQYFEQAIAVDPQYAAAYAYLSESYSALVGNSLADPKEYVPKAEAAARKALQLDESLPEAHKALAGVYLHQWKWNDAGREFERAIELNPNFRDAHFGYAFYLSIVGRHDEAVAEAKRAVDLDPESPMARGRVALCLHQARRSDEAIEAANKLVEMDPDYRFGYVVLGYSYAGAGRHREAIRSYLELVRKGGLGSSNQIYLGASYAYAGERARAIEILNQLKSSKEYVSPGELPVLLVALGDYDAAFESFEKAYEAHDLQLMYLKVDPSFDPVRNDPRFADLIRRVGLPE